MKHKPLVIEEREQIFGYLQQNKGTREIGRLLKRPHSTISREITRAGGKSSYIPSRADLAAKHRKMRCGRKKIVDSRPEALQEVFAKLVKSWSPEQIAVHLKNKFPKAKKMQLSHETIYRTIYAFPRGELRKNMTQFLRQKRKLRGSRKNAHARRGLITDPISISERPKEVDDRKMPGHWEGDLIMGKGHKTALGVLLERTTRMVFLVPLKAKDSASVREAFVDQFKDLPQELKQSLTYDRGSEMAQHKEFSKDTGMTVYFADPHSPWQRGSCENTNGLIRQYFPKGTDFSKITIDEIKYRQDELNERPRIGLGFKTPKELFYKLIGATKS